jgi:hypothetical protein
MDIFSQILQPLPMEAKTTSTINHFGGATPFKAQVNFDVHLFEGKIYGDSLEKWLNLLEGYYHVQKISDIKKITFALLKALPHAQYWWESYGERHDEDDSTTFKTKST